MKMNKIVTMLLFVFFVCVGSASAATPSSGGTLSLDGVNSAGAAATDVLVVGLSPKVSVYQYTNGTAVTTSQWYSISSGHPGGNRCYGTAQDVNNIYYREYTTAAELSTYLQSIPQNDTTSATWATDWEQ